MGLKWFSLSTVKAYIWCLASSCTSPLREKVERQRPMMREFIKGQDRLFPQLLLWVNECKRESLTVSPIRLGNSVRVRGCWQLGRGLEAGCFAYLSLSSRWKERVWPAAECASFRSQHSYWAEAAEGCWSRPVGATQWEIFNFRKNKQFYTSLCANTYLLNSSSFISTKTRHMHAF